MFIKKNITYLDKLLIRKLTNELNVFLMCEYSECVSERVQRGKQQLSILGITACSCVRTH